MNNRFIFCLLVSGMIGSQGCCRECHDPDKPKTTYITNDFGFKAINLTIDDGKLTANGNSSVIINSTIVITVNGVTTTIHTNSNQLPVRVGDEIEVLFVPERPEQTEAEFTMPDGLLYKVTDASPSCKWSVPSDFIPGMKIKGKTCYETNDTIFNKTGEITLVEYKQ